MRRFQVKVNGINYDVEVEEVGGASAAQVVNSQPVAAPAAVQAVPAPAAVPAAKPAAVADGTQVTAPMPGNILDIKVSVGDDVSEGDALIILEAMKMENEIPAPVSGKVAGVQVSKGAAVNSGDVLIVIA